MERKGVIPKGPVQVETLETPARPVKPTVAKKYKEPEEPVLHIIEKDGKLIVKGSIKGRYDKKDMLNILRQKLTDLEVVDELETTSDRIPLGWEGRLAESLLIPFISMTENAELHYENGIVTLEGVVENEKAIEQLQKAVINTIYGPYSRDIENNLKVKE